MSIITPIPQDKDSIYKRYAALLVHYCLALSPGKKVLVRSTALAEPLLQPLYAEITKAGAWAEFELTFENQNRLFYLNADNQLLNTTSPFYAYAAEHFDAILSIRAPHAIGELKDISADKRNQHQEAGLPTKKIFKTRSAAGDLKWCLCVFPTPALAEQAGMSLEEYEAFVFQACFVTQEDPITAWQNLGKTQQKIVDFLNQKTHFRYKSPDTDITFTTKGRIWINSDGKRNMPSGEVFTSPEEESVNGTVRFTYPTLHGGHDVQDVTLTVQDGWVTHWTAGIGQQVLDDFFKIPGARRFGEAAIGTNKHIQQATKSILFDEKIGGSIHMALGSSYPEAGGKNESSAHWDMIKDMTQGGQIWADGELIYQDGAFVLN